MKTPYSIVSTTIDDLQLARKIIALLLEKRLIACAQIYPVESRYHWKGDIAEEKEWLVQMKTKTVHFSTIQKEIEALHSYEVPEIIMTPIEKANRAYLEWLEKELT